MFAGLKNAFGFRDEQKAISVSEQAEVILLDIRSTASNIHVGSRNAREVPAVDCAIDIIAKKNGDIPFKFFTRETRETVRDHPAYKLIHDEANAFTSAAQLRIDLSVDAMLYDQGGHAFVIRSSDDRPIALQRLKPGTVQNCFEDDDTPYYLVSDKRGQRRYEFTDILHIQPYGCKAPIKTAREAIALAMAFERHMAGLLANGGRPSGIIKAKKPLDPEAKKKLSESWFTTHGGKNAGGTAVLDEEMDYLQLALNLVDAQFAESRVEQIREIARAFKIPPTM
ncbi:MAG: phage portal protein, partial [Rhizobium sp.]